MIRSLAWSPKGKEILIGEMQTRVAVRYDVDTLKPVGENRAFSVRELGCLQCRRKTIVTAGNDHCVQLWSGVTGGRLGVPLEHPGDVQSVAISADGQTIVSADSDSTVRVWEKAPGNLIRTIYGPNWIRRGVQSRWSINSAQRSGGGVRLGHRHRRERTNRVSGPFCRLGGGSCIQSGWEDCVHHKS